MSDRTDQNGSAPATPPQTPAPGIAQPTGPLNDNDDSMFGIIQNRIKGWLRGNPPLETAQQTTVVEEQATIGEVALDADTSIADIVSMLAASTGDTADVIQGIEDDKEHPAAKVIIQVLIVLGYIAPPVLSVLVGIAIGIQYSDGMIPVLAVAIFSVCVFYEIGLVWLMFAVVKLARRVMSTGKGFFGLAGVGLIYVAVAVGSALAQWVIYEGHVNLSEPSQVAGAVIRTFAVPIVDTICAIALPILTHVSLDKRLAEIRKKTEATIAINKQKIAAQLALIQEAIVTKSTLQKEKDYQAKNDLANSLINLISDKILADARNGLNGTGNGNRRDNWR